jgi:hypothetical protein
MRITTRVASILETAMAIERLSEKVQGMILMGQDRDDLKVMTRKLARQARVLAALCGDSLSVNYSS